MNRILVGWNRDRRANEGDTLGKQGCMTEGTNVKKAGVLRNSEFLFPKVHTCMMGITGRRVLKGGRKNCK